MPTSETFISGFEAPFRDIGTPEVLTGHFVTASVSFTGLAVTTPPAPLWDMGDGNIKVGGSITHTYIDGKPTHVVNIQNLALLNIQNLNVESNNILSVDLSLYTSLLTLALGGNPSLPSIDVTNLTSLSVFTMFNNGMSPAAVDNIIITVDGHGNSNGQLSYNGNDTPTLASLTAYNNLVGRGWTIIGPVPS